MQIGNAVINDETDLKGMYDFFWSHAIISDQVKNDIFGNCNFSPSAATQSDKCHAAANQVEEDIQYLDVYNIYAPVCLSSNLTVRPKKLTVSHFNMHQYLLLHLIHLRSLI